MKVIKDNSKIFTCENCGSIIELEHSREVIWNSGYIYWECIVCGERNILQKDPFE